MAARARWICCVAIAIVAVVLAACGGGRTGTRDAAPVSGPTPVSEATPATTPSPTKSPTPSPTTSPTPLGDTGSAATTVPPIEACLERPPVRPAAFDAALELLEPPWLAADLADRVPLGDGGFLWIFGDTVTGHVGSDGRLLPGWSMVRSSAVIQTGRCFEVVDVFPDRSWIPAPSVVGRWRWPQEAIVLDGDIHVFAVDLETLPSGVYGLDFETVGGAIATYPLDDLRVPTSITGEVPTVDGNPFGFGPLVDDGWLHLYSQGPRTETFAARVDPAHLHTIEHWSFWNGSDWVPDVAEARSISPHHLRVFRSGGVFRAVAVPFLTAELHLYEASTPVGPWTLGQVVDLEPFAPDVACFAYQPLVVDPLVVAHRTDRLTIGVNFLPRCLDDTLADISRYGPEFITVTIPQ